MSVNLDDNITRAACGLWLNGSVYRRWTAAEQTAGIPIGIPALPEVGLHKINLDGTGEITANSNTMPKTEEKTGTFKAKFTPLAVGAHSGTITTDSDATVEETATIEGSGIIPEVSKYNFNVNAAVRWDQVSQTIYGDPNYVEELMFANPHISLEYRKNLVMPYPSVIYAPTLEEIKELSTALDGGGSFPSWMYT